MNPPLTQCGRREGFRINIGSVEMSREITNKVELITPSFYTPSEATRYSPGERPVAARNCRQNAAWS